MQPLPKPLPTELRSAVNRAAHRHALAAELAERDRLHALALALLAEGHRPAAVAVLMADDTRTRGARV